MASDKTMEPPLRGRGHISSDICQLHAIEAILHDTASLMSVFHSIQQHPKAGLLLPGLLPQASMYVVESHRYLSTLNPNLIASLPGFAVDLLKPSRQRAKLLDDSQKSVGGVARDLSSVANQQKHLFLEPHTDLFGPLKRLIQPDLGLSTYEGHIFSTTHATAFNFGEGCDYTKSAFSIGQAIGEYTRSVASLFRIELPPPLPISTLPGNIEMRDIKSPSIYQRGPLGIAPLPLAVGLIFLLVNLNYVHYIMRQFLPAGGLTFFRQKFIVAFHADANLRVIQSILSSDSPLVPEMLNVFRETLGTEESKWLRKRSRLRNLLAHYSADRLLTAKLPLDAPRKQVIEHLSGKLTYNEIDALLDRHIVHMSRNLEIGFKLTGDPFWYGRVT